MKDKEWRKNEFIRLYVYIFLAMRNVFHLCQQNGQQQFLQQSRNLPPNLGILHESWILIERLKRLVRARKSAPAIICTSLNRLNSGLKCLNHRPQPKISTLN